MNTTEISKFHTPMVGQEDVCNGCYDNWPCVSIRVAAMAWDEGFAAGWTQADVYENPYREGSPS